METSKENNGSVVTPTKSDQRSQDINLNMNIAATHGTGKENVPVEVNALIIRSKIKLPKSIKEKMKKMGAVWNDAYQAYAILLDKKIAVEGLLAPWKEKISFSTGYIDPHHFSFEGKAEDQRDLRFSILHEQIHKESMQLMVDINAYNPSLSELDFDEKPSREGKTSYQVQKEAEFHERRLAILEKQKDLESLQNSSPKMRQGTHSYRLDENGLWFLEDEENKIWISSSLHVTARTRDENGLSHGKLLEFDDADNVHHIWAMPMEMLAGDCSEFRKSLLNAGLEISTAVRARQLLADYIQRSDPPKTIRCVSKTGWYKEAFILPDKNFGKMEKESVVIQSKHFNFRSYATAGTLQDWQQLIADRAVGNSRLIFAISAGFAGPCLGLMETESGGFHFRSQSSSGKTTALRAAASIFGDKNFMRKWKATVNGLEAIAFQHNDTLLCLDEIGEMSGHDLGASSYMLANGSGKERSRSEGGLRESLSWKILFLSSGEISLSAHMEQAGKKAKAGQEIRLAEIPSDTGKYGIFEELHGFPNGSVFAETLTKDAQKYYGVASHAFLKRLTENISEAKGFLKKKMNEFLSEAIPYGDHGQIYRVATRFALVAAAGELATHYNITRVIGADAIASIGWDGGMAKWAAMKCFRDWLEAFGGMKPQEETQLLADLRYFLEQHAESRFTDWHANPVDRDTPISRTHNRAGFRKPSSEGTEFYIFPETFKRDICKGHDEKFVKEVLFRHGLLKKDSEGKYTRSAKPPSETKSQRFYLITLTPTNEEGPSPSEEKPQ